MQPSGPSPATGACRASGFWLGALAFAFVLLGLPTLYYPFGRDQAMFAYVGAVWRSGGLPYRDAWDVKPPGIYAVYALVGGAEWGPRALDLLAIAVTAGLLLRLARETGACRVGPLAGVVWLIYTFGALNYWNLAQAEVLLAPLTAGAVLCALRGRPLAAGLLAGLAATLKTTAVLSLAPVLLACWSAGEEPPAPRLRSVGLVAAGWLLPLAAFGVYFAARGGLPYLAEVLHTQAEYAGGDPRLRARGLVDAVRLLALPDYLPLLPLSALGLLVWARDDSLRPLARAAVAAWWMAALLQVVVQRRFYLYHWTVFTAPAALLAAYGLDRLARRAGERTGSRSAGALVLVGAVLALGGCAVEGRRSELARAAGLLTGRLSAPLYRLGFHGVFGFSVADAVDAAAHVRARSQPADGVWVRGFEPEVYLYSDRRAPTRHASFAPIVGETSIAEARRRRWFEELFGDLTACPPLYLIERSGEPAPEPAWTAPLDRLRDGGYALEARFGRFRVYRRLDRPGVPG